MCKVDKELRDVASSKYPRVLQGNITPAVFMEGINKEMLTRTPTFTSMMKWALKPVSIELLEDYLAEGKKPAFKPRQPPTLYSKASQDKQRFKNVFISLNRVELEVKISWMIFDANLFQYIIVCFLCKNIKLQILSK